MWKLFPFVVELPEAPGLSHAPASLGVVTHSKLAGWYTHTSVQVRKQLSLHLVLEVYTWVQWDTVFSVGHGD